LPDEKNRRPFLADWYRKVFRVVRHVAATGQDPKTKDSATVLKGIDLDVALGRHTAADRPPAGVGRPAGGPAGEAGGAAREAFIPVPTLEDLHDQDLRDTAVTWLARAGCDAILISSITGHELASIRSILKHYLGLHPELARTAIGRMVTWMEGQG